MANEYDNWFSLNLSNLIHAIEEQKNATDIEPLVSEVKRGIAYSSENPGSINPLLIRMGEGLLGPVLLTYKFDGQKKTKKADINVDELQMALKNREKNKVINKMSGSLRSLEDFES